MTDEHNILVTGDAPEELLRFCASEILQAEDTEITAFHSVTMIDLLVATGCFPSKGQARKNWKGPIEVPLGFSTWEVGKRRVRLDIHRVVPEA